VTILVTGGAGFIGSHFVTEWLANSHAEPVVNLDALTYAGNRANLAGVWQHSGHQFVHGDINNRPLLDQLLATWRPRAVVHLAAETHVDRSTAGPMAFVQANVNGTATLLEASRAYWQGLGAAERAAFRFLHVSTDEVYGATPPGAAPFAETQALAPSNPYAASKAASDHLVAAWHSSYGFPVLTTRCCNNYGPAQFPEKLIPLMIAKALAGERLPVYGDGQQTRQWLHVADHCAALRAVLQGGQVGEIYHVAGEQELSNQIVVHAVCGWLDALRPRTRGPHAQLIGSVADRPAHDRRYALDDQKLRHELGWWPQQAFAPGLRDTVQWTLDHPSHHANAANAANAATAATAATAVGDAAAAATLPARADSAAP
jgi:dTDP-glucose 4,6-dehydratase